MQFRALTARKALPWVGFVLAVLAPAAWAQSPAQDPAQHRALYLYNFAKFTKWPKEAFTNETSPFVIGVLGEDPIGKGLDIIKGKSLKHRQISVKFYSKVEDVDDCQLLFISSSLAGNLDHILPQLEQRPILTVSEVENGSRYRPMINLYVDGKFLAFEIDKAAADRAGLKLDTQLLRLARAAKKNQEATP